jgi:hypothetical protein
MGKEMRRSDAMILVALIVFLFLVISAPIMIYAVQSHDLSYAATVGFFALPVAFLLAAAVILAFKKSAGGSTVRQKVVVSQKVKKGKYDWEKYFELKEPARKKELPKQVVEIERPTMPVMVEQPPQKTGSDKAILVVLLIIALILLIVLSPAITHILGPDLSNMSNSSIHKVAANKTMEKATAKTNVSPANVKQPVNMTKKINVSEKNNITKKFNLSQKNLTQNVSKTPGFGITNLVKVSKLNYIALGFFLVVVFGAFVYSHRSVQLAGSIDWFKLAIHSVYNNIGRLVVFAIIAAVAILAIIFWKAIATNEISQSIIGFFPIYRNYILGGIAGAVVLIGLIFMSEKRNEKKTDSTP